MKWDRRGLYPISIFFMFFPIESGPFYLLYSLHTSRVVLVIETKLFISFIPDGTKTLFQSSSNVPAAHKTVSFSCCIGVVVAIAFILSLHDVGWRALTGPFRGITPARPGPEEESSLGSSSAFPESCIASNVSTRSQWFPCQPIKQFIKIFLLIEFP